MGQNHQLENPLRNKLDKLLNTTLCQAQAKALPRMKDLTDKARIGAYLDIEFGSYDSHLRLLSYLILFAYYVKEGLDCMKSSLDTIQRIVLNCALSYGTLIFLVLQSVLPILT